MIISCPLHGLERARDTTTVEMVQATIETSILRICWTSDGYESLKELPEKYGQEAHTFQLETRQKVLGGSDSDICA
jgi:hypothetical protein